MEEVVDLTQEEVPGAMEPARARMSGHALEAPAGGLAPAESPEGAAQRRASMRRSLRRERLESQYRRLLQSIDPAEARMLRKCYQELHTQKMDIYARRRQLLQLPQAKEERTARVELALLDAALLQFDQWVVQVRSGAVRGAVIERMRREGVRVADGLRSRIQGLHTEAALSRMQSDAGRRTSQMIAADPAYVAARENSLVTPQATTTMSAYRPDVNPATSNAEVMRRALADAFNPGLLPDRSSLMGTPAAAALGQDRFADYLAGGPAPPPGPALPPSAEALEEQRVMEAAYEHMIDLATQEAQPLDMPPQLDVRELEHQRLGLGWLVRAEKGAHKGGILADDMGLGKTVQTIALMFANRPDLERFPKHKLVLVVCPVALIDTWCQELANRVKPGFRPRVYVHHRGTNPRILTRAADMDAYDVVVCTYHAITAEYKQLEAQAQQKTHGPHPLFDVRWHRVVLDEAHTIKNRNSQVSVACTRLHARFRLALTGTPMQNKIEELYPLIRFLRIEPYCDSQKFAQVVPHDRLTAENLDVVGRRLATLLSAVMLRRRKDTVIKGRKIVDNLPKKEVFDIYVRMEGDELKGYHDLENRIQSTVLSEAEFMSFTNMLVLLLRMRMRVCHAHLGAISRRARGAGNASRAKQTRDHVLAALSIPADHRLALLALPAAGRACTSCGEHPDKLNTYVICTCTHLLCGQCQEAVAEEISEAGGAKCERCGRVFKAAVPLEVITLIESMLESASIDDMVATVTAAQAPRVQQAQAEQQTRIARLRELQAEAENNEFDVNDDDDDELLDLRFDAKAFKEDLDSVQAAAADALNGPPAQIEASDLLDDSSEDGVEGPIADASNGPPAQIEASDLLDSAEEDMFVDVASEESPSARALAVIKAESQASARGGSNDQPPPGRAPAAAATPSSGVASWDPKDGLPRAVKEGDPMDDKISIDEVARLFRFSGLFDNGWVSSAKVDSLMRVLNEILKSSPTEKVIVFTSFTSFIEVLTIPLDAARVQYLRYTGAMSIDERNEALRSFKVGTCRVLLTSLRAGNVGLTLTEANHVIIMEPFWNPYVEEQAQDRVYRIGQSRDVRVYRLRVKDSVEDRIIELQESKRGKIESALDPSVKTMARGLSRQDLLYALGVSHRR